MKRVNKINSLQKLFFCVSLLFVTCTPLQAIKLRNRAVGVNSPEAYDLRRHIETMLWKEFRLQSEPGGYPPGEMVELLAIKACPAESLCSSDTGPLCGPVWSHCVAHSGRAVGDGRQPLPSHPHPHEILEIWGCLHCLSPILVVPWGFVVSFWQRCECTQRVNAFITPHPI